MLGAIFGAKSCQKHRNITKVKKKRKKKRKKVVVLPNSCKKKKKVFPAHCVSK